MRRGLLFSGLLATLAAPACARELVPSQVPEADIAGLVERARARERAPGERRPLVVLLGKFDVEAVDPVSEVVRWRHGAVAVGRPVADGDHVYLPLRGRRIVALGREDGQRRWEAPFPGEALVGLAVGERELVITSTSGRRGHITAVDTRDGALRWSREVDGVVGRPAVVGALTLLSVDAQILALRTASGRASGRSSTSLAPAPALEVVRRGARVWVRGPAGELDLGRPARPPWRVRDPHAREAGGSPGIDPGSVDADRVRWVVAGDPGGGLAVLMARRAVLGVTLDDHGRARGIAWAHLGPAGEEYVAVDRSLGRVNLVSESGALVTLSPSDGRVFARRPGHRPAEDRVRGALLLDHDRFEALGDRQTQGRDAEAIGAIQLAALRPLDEQLAELLADADPRSWPAQALAVRLAASEAEDLSVLELAVALAAGGLRDPDDPAAEGLRALAATGLAAREDGAASELAGVRALRAATGGDPGAVEALASQLLDPRTPAAALEPVAQALCALDQPAGTRALADFARMYHADAAAMVESRALSLAVACLVERSPGDGLARETLAELRRDPFTEPALRVYMDETLGGVELLADGPPAAPEPASPPRDADASRAPERPRPPTLPDPGL